MFDTLQRMLTKAVDDKLGKAIDVYLSALDVDAVTGTSAAELLPLLSRHIDRLVAARLRVVHSVAEGSAHIIAGSRDAASFVAEATGTSVTDAKRSLDLAARLESQSVVEKALRSGQISSASSRDLPCRG